MIKGNNGFLKFMRLFSLGYMGGTIYLLMYVRYVFYEQTMTALNCTNAQLGFLNTICSIVSFPLSLIGAYWADKLDAKNVILFSVSGITALSFIWAIFPHSYTVAVLIFVGQAVVMMAYWACLIKYINNLGGEEEAGNSFGIYYLINGLSGAFGNAFPLWIVTKFDLGLRGILVTYGAITLVATLLVWLFLENEKGLAERGIQLKGDEPINIRHIPYVLKWPGTYIIFFAYLTTYTLYSNVSYFNPFLVDVIGIDPDASSVYSVIRSYGAMVVAPLGGIMADKVFKSTSTWYIVAFAIAGVMWAIPFLFTPESNVTLVCIYSILPSLVIFALYSVTYSILRELHIPATVAGTAIGISSTSGTFVDGVWPVLFGGWIDKHGNAGYTMIFTTLIVICVVGILNAFWAKRLDKQCREGKKTLNLSGIE